MSVENAIYGILTLLIIIAIGAIIYKKGIISEQVETAITKITIGYSIPFLLIDNCIKYISLDFFKEMGIWFLVPFGVNAASLLMALLLYRVFKIKKENRGVFISMFSFSNCIFIGLPVNLAIFGEAASPYVMAYFFPNTILFWTIGNMSMAVDGGRKFKFNLNTLKSIFSPPIWGFLIGSVIAVSGLKPPDFVMSVIKYMGSLTIPLSLILTGAVFARMGLSAFRIPKEGVLVLCSKLLLGPALALSVCGLLGAPPIMSGVFATESAMPVMNQVSILSRHYNANYRLTAQMMTVTTAVSLIYIPFLVFVMGLLFGS